MDWMKTSVGVSVHWTTHTAARDGSRATYAQAVEGFDAARFVRSLKQAGAQHCIFTLTHAEQYLALPCAPLEEILPGRTTGRDLIGEVAEGLAREGIRFIAYYNHSCNGEDDPAWKAACGYAAGEKGNLDAFAGRIAGIVRTKGRQRLSGSRHVHKAVVHHDRTGLRDLLQKRPVALHIGKLVIPRRKIHRRDGAQRADQPQEPLHIRQTLRRLRRGGAGV